MRAAVYAVFAALFLTAATPAAFAQEYPGGGPGPMAPEQFSEMKARVLKMIEERKTRLDQEKACVEAATNADELRKCRPERPMMGPGGPGREGRSRPGMMEKQQETK